MTEPKSDSPSFTGTFTRDPRREIALETAVRISGTGAETAETVLAKADKIYKWLKGA